MRLLLIVLALAAVGGCFHGSKTSYPPCPSNAALTNEIRALGNVCNN